VILGPRWELGDFRDKCWRKVRGGEVLVLFEWVEISLVVTWNGIDEMRWSGVDRVVIMMDGSIPMNYAHQFIIFS